MYIYIAYITYKYNANDLIQWREQQLQQVEEKYAQMPLDDTPPVNITPPP